MADIIEDKTRRGPVHSRKTWIISNLSRSHALRTRSAAALTLALTALTTGLTHAQPRYAGVSHSMLRKASAALSPGKTQRIKPKVTYWHTDGDRIVDADDKLVRIAAVNWGGMQTGNFVPDGLNAQPLDRIMSEIERFGFNTIRLPFSNQMVEQDPVVTQNLYANPQLVGKHALGVLDQVVASAGAHGIRIILEDQRSNEGVNPESNGLWYTSHYPESAWLRDWQRLALRYKGDPTVVGFDLRDEPHTAPPGPWSVNTYLHQGATWGPYDGRDAIMTDWRLAAQRAGDAVLSVNRHLLIFVEGLQQYPEPGAPGGLDSYWWGGALEAARLYPIRLTVPNQLVYSPHEYGPQKAEMPFFGPHMTYKSLLKVWTQHWGYLLHLDGGVPIFVGEFGTCETSRSCVSNNKPGSQGLWFQLWIQFLRAHPNVGWGFWALDGTNALGEDQPNYILSEDWASARLPALISALHRIEQPS